MERLTNNHDVTYICNFLNNHSNFNGDLFKAMYEKLSAYEDSGLTPAKVQERAKAEAEGRLVVLPLKENTPVFMITEGYCEHRNKDVCNAYCEGWDITCTERKAEKIICKVLFKSHMADKWGKTVFLTREEAEVVLKGEK